MRRAAIVQFFVETTVYQHFTWIDLTPDCWPPTALVLAWMPMQKKKPNKIAGLLAFFPR